MKKYLYHIFSILAILLISCGSSEYLQISDITYPPVKDCFLFEDIQKIPYQYEVIGTIKAWRAHNPLKADDIKELQLIGKNNGADGIIEVSKVERLCISKAIRFKRDDYGVPVRKK